MATFTVGYVSYGINMDRIDISHLIEGIPSVRASTRFEMGYAGSVWSDTFIGTGFTYDRAGEPLSGTITSYSHSESSVDEFTFSGLAIPVEQMLNWVSNSNNAQFLLTALSGADSIIGGAHNDLLRGLNGNDSIEGGGGNDSIDGGSGWNVLFGGDGDDLIHGGSGASFNRINGNKGDDLIRGRSAIGDWLLGGQGNDWIDATASTGRNIINGNMGNDTIQGSDHGDTLRGGQGDDVIFDGDGNDVIFSDLGNDTINGGSGDDEFHFSWGSGNDFIENFFRNDGHGDRIVLHGSGTYTLIDDWAVNRWVIDMGNGQRISMHYNDNQLADQGRGADYGTWITVVP